MSGLYATFRRPDCALQTPFEVAVVIPSILRPLLADALRSVFAQNFPGRIQVMIGIDRAGDETTPDLSMVEEVCGEIPQNCAVQVLYPGYSTSVRHGGLSPARDGGTLRTLLTHLANSDHVAYLDDDNAWTPDHLFRLRHAFSAPDIGYAFSLRWFVHHRTGERLAIDRWESLGPGQGIFAQQFGGFCDPNTLMIDRRICREVIVGWTMPLEGDPKGMSADRIVFDRLRRHFKGAGTDAPTALYRLDPTDVLHPSRVRAMGVPYPD